MSIKKLVLIDLDGVILKNSLQLASRFVFDFLNQRTEISYITVERFFKIANSFSPELSFKFFFESLGLAYSLNELTTEIKRFAEYKEEKVYVDPYFEHFISYLRQESVNFLIFSLASTSRIMNSVTCIHEAEIYNLSNSSKADVLTFSDFLKQIHRNGIEIIYIDDDPFALRTAKMVNISTILMKSNFFDNDDIRPYESHIDLIVENFQELLIKFQGEHRW